MNLTRDRVNTITLPDETWEPLTFLDEKTRTEYLKNIQSSSRSKMNTDSNLDLEAEIFIKTNCISEAKGSCYIELGNTKVICALYGPREIPKKDEFSYKLANLHCEFRFATFSSPFLAGNLNTTNNTSTFTSIFQQQSSHQHPNYYLNQNISTLVTEALKPSVLLHKYPKSQIDIYIICLQSDLTSPSNSGIISASIIAGSMALVDASIECYDLVSSYTNPSSGLTLAYMQSLDQITSVYYTGASDDDKSTKALSINLYKSLIKNGVENCKRIYALMKYVLVDKEIKKLKSDE